MVLDDGDSLKVGDTMIKFYVTPGHTEGVLSMEFPVRDGETVYRAFVFGGVGLNFSGVSRTQSYIESVRRIQDMMAEPHPIQVNISNHPGPGQIFDRRDRLRVRQEGDPHPYVDPEGYRAWLDQLLRDAEEKLETERAAARN
jgi:metallo-beta-lactamase class B